MTNKKLTFGEIWKTLRGVDISHLVVKKGDLDYLNWADAWTLLMEYYPEATCDFDVPTFYGIEGQETCEVHSMIVIDGFIRRWSLPVMASMLPMKSVVNPTSRDINDAKARCFVKTLALFGLGLSLWEKKNNKYVKKVAPSGDMPF